MGLCDHSRKILTNLSSFHLWKNHNETQILTKESFGPYWIQINLQCIEFRSKKTIECNKELVSADIDLFALKGQCFIGGSK